MLPVLVELFGVKIFTYPLMIGISTGVGLSLLNSLRASKKITTHYFNFFFLGTLFFAWFGAKLFFLLFSQIENSSRYVLNTNFWMGGGFVFYGGLIFATLYVLSIILVFKMFSWEEGKFLLPIVCIVHGIGRIGCLLAGCCFGSETNFFVSVNHRHPVQFYEALILILFGLYFYRLVEKLNTTQALSIYFIFYSVLRFNMEFLRGDFIRGTVMGLTSSQFISIFIFGAGIILFLIEKRKTNLLKQ